jgi:hypothetical protein
MISIITGISILILGFIFGVRFNQWSFNINVELEKLKKIKKIKDTFKNLMESIENKTAKFKTRVNNSVILLTKLENLGKVEVIYLLDKKEISIFQDTKCLYNSSEIEKEFAEQICNSIYSSYQGKIEDVIEVMGMTIYREEFEKAVTINMDQLKKQMKEKDQKEISKIVEENHQKFDIDEILDKINKVGIQNLTPEEKNFLDNYNK